MSKGKDRIREGNLRYKQSLGQNFLYDEALLAELVRAAEVSPEEDAKVRRESYKKMAGQA